MFYLICAIIVFVIVCIAAVVGLLVAEDAALIPGAIIASALAGALWPLTVISAICVGGGYLIYRKWFKK